MMSENGGRYQFSKRVNIFTNGHYIFTQENPVDNNVSAQSSVFSASLAGPGNDQTGGSSLSWAGRVSSVVSPGQR